MSLIVIHPGQISTSFSDDVDYLLITFARPLSADDTEELCEQLSVEKKDVKFLTHELHREKFEGFAKNSAMLTKRYLNSEQIAELNQSIEGDYFHREIRIKGGVKHSDKTFFIVRYGLEKVGLFTAYVVYAGYIRYAINKGYIPVIDMQNYPNIYLESDD